MGICLWIPNAHPGTYTRVQMSPPGPHAAHTACRNRNRFSEQFGTAAFLGTRSRKALLNHPEQPSNTADGWLQMYGGGCLLSGSPLGPEIPAWVPGGVQKQLMLRTRPPRPGAWHPPAPQQAPLKRLLFAALSAPLAGLSPPSPSPACSKKREETVVFPLPPPLGLKP